MIHEFDRKPESIRAIQWTSKTTLNEALNALWKSGASDFTLSLGRHEHQGKLCIVMPLRNKVLYVEPDGYIVFSGGGEVGALTESELVDQYHNGRPAGG